MPVQRNGWSKIRVTCALYTTDTRRGTIPSGAYAHGKHIKYPQKSNTTIIMCSKGRRGPVAHSIRSFSNKRSLALNDGTAGTIEHDLNRKEGKQGKTPISIATKNTKK